MYMLEFVGIFARSTIISSLVPIPGIFETVNLNNFQQIL